uniref:Uncharacterized protein n=1 Tax=Arundo donax TaxID=35708 RepID=A0A0A9BCJ5_ARUDO
MEADYLYMILNCINWSWFDWMSVPWHDSFLPPWSFLGPHDCLI